MRFFCFMALAVISIASSRPAQADVKDHLAILAKDAPRAVDHPLTGRYKGSNLPAQNVKAFDEISLAAGPAEGKPYDHKKHFTKVETVQGKVTRTVYVAPSGRSSLEVFANYRDALGSKGFEPMFECAREARGESFSVLKYNWQDKTHVLGEGYEHPRVLTIGAIFDRVQDPRYVLFKQSSSDGDSYAAVPVGFNQGGSFGSFSELLSGKVTVLVEIVEPRGMDKRMVTISAEEIGVKLASEGRAVFYNILFDFDKADSKPESAPQLGEMAAFLKANPQTKVFVIGHTDNKGGLDYNIGLSGRRAQAVAKTLTAQYGIASLDHRRPARRAMRIDRRAPNDDSARLVLGALRQQNPSGRSRCPLM